MKKKIGPLKAKAAGNRVREDARVRGAAGRALRVKTPRSAHAEFSPVRRGRDIVAMLEKSNRTRVPALVPIRYGRMLHSPFSFLRGAAGIMAYDLSRTPLSGISVQAGGDAHLMNFGGFATPERHLVFDLNDFDETLPAPWEWDLKRLAASVTVAGRYRGFSKRKTIDATLAAVAGYRTHMLLYAPMRALELWYQRIDAGEVVELNFQSMSRASGNPDNAPLHPVTAHMFPKITEANGSLRRIKEQPPLVFRPRKGDRTLSHVPRMLEQYRATLPPDRRTLLERFKLVDVAIKVVGVGSVGTRCAIVLLMGGDHDSLFLQLKEARASVLEPYTRRSSYRNHGERVVQGQRLMQSASDLFLGWSRDASLGVDFYVRQLRDCKTAADIDTMSSAHLLDYANHCGAALARAHAKTGDAAAISGYIGQNTTLDSAVTRFAAVYADQTEKDFETLQQAAKSGRISVEDA